MKMMIWSLFAIQALAISSVIAQVDDIGNDNNTMNNASRKRLDPGQNNDIMEMQRFERIFQDFAKQGDSPEDMNRLLQEMSMSIPTSAPTPSRPSFPTSARPTRSPTPRPTPTVPTRTREPTPAPSPTLPEPSTPTQVPTPTITRFPTPSEPSRAPTPTTQSREPTLPTRVPVPTRPPTPLPTNPPVISSSEPTTLAVLEPTVSPQPSVTPGPTTPPSVSPEPSISTQRPTLPQRTRSPTPRPTNPRPSNTPGPTPRPTPVCVEDDKEAILLEVLSDVTDESVLLDMSTAQGMAYFFLVNENPSFVCSPTILQRYSLSTLYFSTDGSRWTNNDGWLDSTNECSWFGVECNSEGLVIRLDLGKFEIF